jgi:hypothetical protein
MDEQTQNLDELTPETEADVAPEAAEAVDGAEGADPSLLSGDAAEATDVSASAPVEAEPARPREVIKGINPELKCECPECAPEFTELQWFSPEEEKKTKGQVMLYCQRSSRKYFSPAKEFQDWVEKNKPVGKRKKDAS